MTSKPRHRKAKRSTTPVKRALTSYNLFAKEMISQLKKDKGLTMIEASRECGKLWATMSEKQKEKFASVAAEDRKRYEAQKQEALKEAKVGKKALSSYMMFAKEMIPKLKKEREIPLGEAAKECGKLWSVMTDKEKEPYIKLAGEDKQRYLTLILTLYQVCY